MNTQDLALNIFQDFHRLMNLFGELKERPFHQPGQPPLYPGEMQVLLTVLHREGASVTEVGAALGITKSAASQFLFRLEEKGMLEKTRTVENRKSYVLKLTPAGRSSAESFRLFWQDFMEPAVQFIGTLDPVTLGQIRGVLAKLELAMNELLVR